MASDPHDGDPLSTASMAESWCVVYDSLTCDETDDGASDFIGSDDNDNVTQPGIRPSANSSTKTTAIGTTSPTEPVAEYISHSKLLSKWSIGAC